MASRDPEKEAMARATSQPAPVASTAVFRIAPRGLGKGDEM